MCAIMMDGEDRDPKTRKPVQNFKISIVLVRVDKVNTQRKVGFRSVDRARGGWRTQVGICPSSLCNDIDDWNATMVKGRYASKGRPEHLSPPLPHAQQEAIMGQRIT
jgi:hypothetical protein